MGFVYLYLGFIGYLLLPHLIVAIIDSIKSRKLNRKEKDERSVASKAESELPSASKQKTKPSIIKEEFYKEVIEVLDVKIKGYAIN